MPVNVDKIEEFATTESYEIVHKSQNEIMLSKTLGEAVTYRIRIDLGQRLVIFTYEQDVLRTSMNVFKREILEGLVKILQGSGIRS